MNAPISNPADCDVRGVIRFLQAENVRPTEIHRRLVAVYGEHVMNVASVRKWCTMFRNGRTDVHDAERSGRPSVITDALKQKVNRIIWKNRHFTISEVYEQCPEVSRTDCSYIFEKCYDLTEFHGNRLVGAEVILLKMWLNNQVTTIFL